jgi:RNA methyltransferase, TrmH family
MLTKSRAKLIKSLHEKKYRIEHGLFLVEGEKSVLELLASDFAVNSIFITQTFFDKYQQQIKDRNVEYTILEQEELERVGTLESNDSALAIVQQKENIPVSFSESEIVLALDDIRDPGNLGTILRIADWYGITNIVASFSTTDLYNNKTIAASKGSFTRVHVFYTDLQEYLKNTTVPILGAFLDGEDVHTMSFPKGGILIMGNESLGINPSLEHLIAKKITIPRYGKAESLNVGIATAVILDNWKRSGK